MLAHSSSSFGQDYLRQAYAPLPVGDCYYNIAADCRGLVPVVVPGAGACANVPYAAFHAIPRTFMSTTARVARGLSGADWTAIYGANE